MKLSKTIIKLMVLTLVFMSMVACGDFKGTSDGGGGQVEGSTKEEVRVAVQDTLKTLTQSEKYINYKIYEGLKLSENTNAEAQKALNNIYNPDFHKEEREILVKKREALQADIDSLVSSGVEGVATDELLDLTDQIIDLSKSIKHLEPFEKYKLADYVFKIPVVYQDEGSCPAPDKDHADASVTEFSFDATICFSLENLTRIPKQSLNAHVLGLWMHELAHMTGAGEAAAKQVEESAVRVYPELIKGERSNLARVLSFQLLGVLNGFSLMQEDIRNHLQYVNAIDEEEKEYLKQYGYDKSFSRLHNKFGMIDATIYSFLDLFANESLQFQFFNAVEVEREKEEIVNALKGLRQKAIEFKEELSTPESLTEVVIEKAQELYLESKMIQEKFSEIAPAYE